MNTKIHATAPYILNPNHNLTITVIGCGGNGSLILSRLASIDYALKQSSKPGLSVTVYDDDVVEPYNIGRQKSFSPIDIGEYKAISLTSKINTAFLTNFKAVTKKFDPQKMELKKTDNIYITCVDTASFRIEFDKRIKEISELAKNKRIIDYKKTYYWMDLGNTKDMGQCILSSLNIKQPNDNHKIYQPKLPSIIDRYPNLEKMDIKEIQGNGCSYNQKLEEQNLFINDSITALSSHLLWELLTVGYLKNAGFFINLNNFKSQPILIN